MNAAAYIRVSSRGQHFQLQHHAVTRAAAAQGDEIVRVFEEKKSAQTLDRPELERVRAAARRGELKKLYVYKLDRLTRTGIKDTFNLVGEIRGHGCEVVSCDDGFDLSGPLAEPIMAVLAWAAKMESLQKRERQAAAREAIEEKGGRWGRPRRLTDEQLEAVMTRRQRKPPQSFRGISRDLKIPLATLHDSFGRDGVRKSSPGKAS